MALDESWTELGAEVVGFICKKLGAKPSDINEEAFAKQAAELAFSIAGAVYMSKKIDLAELNSRVETVKIFQKLGEKK